MMEYKNNRQFALMRRTADCFLPLITNAFEVFRLFILGGRVWDCVLLRVNVSVMG